MVFIGIVGKNHQQWRRKRNRMIRLLKCPVKDKIWVKPTINFEIVPLGTTYRVPKGTLENLRIDGYQSKVSKGTNNKGFSKSII